ncbi:MAG TPA: hypothetical protein VK973_12630 [Arenicellales bacterium]|nr:hypothetical protein [Arenicellales bacterium]
MNPMYQTPTVRAALIAGALAIGIPGAAVAQSSGEQAAPSPEAPAVMQEIQSKQQEIQQLMSELRQLQQQATEANPELAAEQEDYRELVINTMSAKDFDPEAEIEELRALQSELQNDGELDQAERRSKMQELEQKTQQFRSRQQEALQTEDVQTAREELDGKIKAAMQEQNPEAENMIARLTELQQEYQQLLQEAMQQQQGGASSPEG